MSAMTAAVSLIEVLLRQIALRTQEKVATKYVPKTYTSDALLLGSAGSVSTFDATSLTNSRYPFVLRMVGMYDTSSPSNWGLRLIDRSTGYALYGGDTFTSTQSFFAKNTPAGTVKAGEPTGLGVIEGFGYIIGPDGGFTAQAKSVGGATVTYLTLQGLWIMEW